MADLAAEIAAGNGLLKRRVFLKAGMAFTGVVSTLAAPSVRSDARQREPGMPMRDYGQPSSYEAHVVRGNHSSQVGLPGSGASRTPLEHLEGTITPASLHFERHHSGVPNLNPESHTLAIYGRVRRSLKFTLNDLLRYPLQSRQLFLECSGNSASSLRDEAADLTCGGVHGLVSGSEWTGVSVATLLDEVGLEKDAAWIIAEGADAARMNRSIPLEKMLDDAFIALFQNGERLRPENGYPMRLFLPGYEGNMSIKWLHRLVVSPIPAMSREETSKYTDLLNTGKAEVFTFDMDVKSTITSPSPGLHLQGPGLYQISGLAWSGKGAIDKVELSADGGKTWALAWLDTPVQKQALTRFRGAWQWDGAPCVLQSRAYDQQGVQPTRSALLNHRGPRSFYHYNAIQSWHVDAQGRLRNVFV